MLGSNALPHTLPDGVLKEALLQRGGTPPSILADAQMRALIAPILRADLRFSDTWIGPASQPGPIDVPLSAFGGTEDPFAPFDRLAAWAQQTTRGVGLHHFLGGYFPIQQNLPALARTIAADIAVARSRAWS